METSKIIKRVQSARALYDALLEDMKTETIAGKTMHAWTKYFKIEVPPDLSPRTCIELLLKVMNLYQEATFYKARAERLYHTFKKTSEAEYRAAFAAEVEKYKGGKVPAKETLATVAENQIGLLRDGCTIGDIELAFWKSIIDSLSNVRKLLEQATMNLGIELKALNNQNIIEAMGNKYG